MLTLRFVDAVACYYYGNLRAPFMDNLGPHDVTETGWQFETWLYGGVVEFDEDACLL